MYKSLATLRAVRVVPCLLAAMFGPFVALHARAGGPDQPAEPLEALMSAQAQTFAQAGLESLALPGRIEIGIGRLDPRLRLAPCDRIEPYLPPGVRLWGRARIGLRCAQGPSKWNVYLPITVRVMARGQVAALALPAGAVLAAADLREAEFDLAEEPGETYADTRALIGRTLARPLLAGQGLRASQLKPRQWFAAGDMVRIVAAGSGYAVSAMAEALTPGFEGQAARVRTESGRVLVGTPVAARQLEIAL